MSASRLPATSDLPPLSLQRREERRLRGGHLWVFSNEVDNAATPLKAFAPGDLARLLAHDGRFLGYVYVNPASLICARVLSRNAAYPPGRSLFVHRLKRALSLRERLYPGGFYRLVHGEADGMPGLVVDRYGDCLVAQMHTAGMEALREPLLEALDKVLRPAGILLRNDTAARDLEGLPRYVGTGLGEVPETIMLEEHGARFEVPLKGGQKTGWFFDQRDNRIRLAGLVRGAAVLDVCAYLGAWAVQAGRGGAASVVCVDESGAALEFARRNLTLNGLQGETLQGDAFATLTALGTAGRRFDVVVLDPPAFVKRRRDLGPGRAAYRKLNQAAMRVLADDGMLVSCSCSYHFPEQELTRVLREAGRHLGREVQILSFGGQAADHPVHPAIPETRYLKALFCRVMRA